MAMLADVAALADVASFADMAALADMAAPADVAMSSGAATGELPAVREQRLETPDVVPTSLHGVGVFSGSSDAMRPSIPCFTAL